MKIVIVFLFAVTNILNAQNYNSGKTKISEQTFKGVLREDELEEFKAFIESTSGLQEIELDNSFLINYKQPEADCFYNHYASNKDCDISFFEDNIYNNIALNEKTLKFYFQHKILPVKKSNDCETKFDADEYLYKRFFEKSNLCYGLILINSKGEFISYMGEYIYGDVQKFLNQLKM